MNNKRIHKGESLLILIDDYVVIDIETTGLDTELDEIIEIAALKVSKGTILEAFTTLVNPNCPINDFIKNLTGISNGMVKYSPFLLNVLDTFIEFIGDSIIIAHNANFDINFIYDKSSILIGKPITNDFIDTCRLSRRIFKELPNHKLGTLANKFDIKQNNAHRALADCYVTYNVYESMKSYLNINLLDINDNSIFSKRFIKSKDIKTEKIEFDTSHPLYGMVCVITGTLSKISRKEAMQTIADFGGINWDRVTKRTNFLILGGTSYTSDENLKSNKQKIAEEYILKGVDLTILSENAFYDIIEK